MKPIFISYSSKHRDLTRQLAAVLEEQYGPSSVWWDHELESRAAYNTQIRAALDEARVVVVVWTAGAMVSDYVYAEAVRGTDRGRLVNVRPVDMAFRDIPEPFNIYHIDDAADHARILCTIAKVMAGTPIPTRVLLHEIYYRQHGKRLLDTKQLVLPSDVSTIRPTELLQAKFEVVAYTDATGMAADMLAWCADEKRAAAGRLIHGPGGLGKTRLLIETAAQLRCQDWMAGFLDRPTGLDAPIAKQRWQALEQLLAHGEDKGVLIVLDYAEGRRDEVAQLAAIFTHAETATRPVRLVLLSRGASVWWDELIQENPEVQRLFHRTGGEMDVIALPSLDTADGRLAFYQHCEAAFASTLAAQGHRAPAASLAEARRQRLAAGDGYTRPLAIQMEALLHLTAATPGAPGIDKQLEAVLGLERAHWDKLCGALDTDARRDMNRGTAQVTAVNGVSSRPSAERLLMADGFFAGARTARVHVDPVYRRLETVYGNVDGELADLEPDLIGEHQVASIGDAELIGGCLAWIEGEPETARADLRLALLTVLQRATRAEHGAAAERAAAMLGHLAGTALAALAADMVQVIVDTPGRLAAILAARLETADDDALAALDAVLPLQSLVLMDISLAVAERRAELAKRASALSDAETDLKLAALSDLAARTGTLGIRLSNLGRREEALAASQEAVDIRRRLAESRPDAFLPDLAMSLNNTGAMLSNLGRREEALAASQEAVDIRRRLAESRPDAFLPDLAMSLNNLGGDLSNLGRREEALAASQEAVDIRRRLAESRPDAFLPDLAMSLNNTGAMLSNLGRREEALAASQEAVDIYRRLAESRPDAFLPDLASSLNNLGIRLSNLGRREEALAASQEAVDIYRRLAESRPDAFLPDLAMSLNNLGIRLSNLGRREEALAASQEAVDIYRRLAESRPDAFLPDLAMSLNNLGIRLSNLGRREEALAASQEAVDIRRRLAESRPDAFLPDLAMSLNNLGIRLSNLGRREEALAASQEAVDIRRRLAESRPDAFLPDLASSLNNTGAMLSNLGRREEALAASQEAVDIRRRLAESRPDAFLPDLAMSLGALGTAYITAEQYEAAAKAFAEGLALVTPFAERHPQALGDLVRGLGQGYTQACEKAGWEPDAALLERAARALGVDGGGGAAAGAPPEIPDEAVRALISEPQLQELLTAVLRQNNIEGAPGELPIEVQRALISALVGQGMIKLGEAEGSEAAAVPCGETATDERGKP